MKKRYLITGLIVGILSCNYLLTAQDTKISRVIRQDPVTPDSFAEAVRQKAGKYAGSSCLSSGYWIKVKIPEDGIYKLTYSQLVSMGVTNPSSPRVFGNGGKMLPFNSALARPDDLMENAIWVEKGTDGIFNQGDYILFYGKGPGEWRYNSDEQMFLHTRHLYSDAAYYYITSDAGTGKSIALTAQVTEPENTIVYIRQLCIPRNGKGKSHQIRKGMV